MNIKKIMKKTGKGIKTTALYILNNTFVEIPVFEIGGASILYRTPVNKFKK